MNSRLLGFLLVGIMSLTLSSFSQRIEMMKALPDSNFRMVKSKIQNQKAYADTLWSEDFDGGLPTCWSIVNNRFNNYQWEWDTLYQPGQFTQNFSRINSTTASNGFMTLNMDFFNTPLAIGGVPLDTYFESCAIPISPRASVELRFQEYNIFCCNDGAKVVVQVSTNNFLTFDEYDLRNEYINAQLTNAEYRSINVSKTLANADTAYLRFYMEGMSHYFWMIDDLALVEGSGQEIYAPSYEFLNSVSAPFLTMYPENYSAPLVFKAGIRSTTSDTITNVNLNTEVVHRQYFNGASGTGMVYQQNNLVNVNGVLLPLDSSIASTSTPRFNPSQNGDYSVAFESTSLEYPQTATDSLQFTISDTVFARDYGTAHTSARSIFFAVAPNSIGDRRGILYTIDSSIAKVQFSSISIYLLDIYDDVEVRPVVWEYDTVRYSSTLGIGPEVASSLSSTMTDTSMNYSWLTLALDTGSAIRKGLNAGQFVVGWEEKNSTQFQIQKFLVAGVDLDAAKFSKGRTSFGSSGQGVAWRTFGGGLMIRLNVKPIVVGVNEDKSSSVSSLKVYPNPTDGMIYFEQEEEVDIVRLYDVKGKEVLIVENPVQKRLDLSAYPTGVYFLEIQTEEGRNYSQKLVKH